MKVLHVTNAYPVSQQPGYGVFIKEQIQSLIGQGIDVDVLFINALIKGKAEYFKKIFEIKKRAQWADVIHCHHMYVGFIVSALARTGKPIVTSFMSPRGTEGRGSGFVAVKSCLFDFVLRHSTCVIQKDTPACEKDHPGKIFYVPNGVDLDRFTEMDRQASMIRLNVDQRKKYILFCAAGNQFRLEKRYDIFRKVVQLVNQRTGGHVNELLLINSEREMVPVYFNAASVFLLTSDHEGSPNSVKEALACNLPVVSTDVGNVRQMIEGVDGCFLVDGNSPEVLADAVMKAMMFDRIKGRDKIISLSLTKENVAEQLICIYRHAIRKHAR